MSATTQSPSKKQISAPSSPNPKPSPTVSMNQEIDSSAIVTDDIPVSIVYPPTSEKKNQNDHERKHLHLLFLRRINLYLRLLQPRNPKRRVRNQRKVHLIRFAPWKSSTLILLVRMWIQMFEHMRKLVLIFNCKIRLKVTLQKQWRCSVRLLLKEYPRKNVTP
jgi:hypothetical protein